MKSFTDLEQSKKLAEILPLESADTFYKRSIGDSCNWELNCKNLFELKHHPAGVGFLLKKKLIVPAWSLSALLDAMPPIQELCSSTDHYYRVHCMNLFSEWHENAIDSCVEMIVKLHEKGLL